MAYNWSEIIQKGMQKAHQAYMDEVNKYRPSNPRSPTYGKDVTEWQKILNIPQLSQAEGMENIRKSVSAPRNSTSDAELDRVKKELAKVYDSKDKVDKDFADLERKYKELDGKLKSGTRKK